MRDVILFLREFFIFFIYWMMLRDICVNIVGNFLFLKMGY